MGRNGTDTNGFYDFWVDGSGGNNCFQGNDTSTFAPTTNASATLAELYPGCPVPSGSQPNPGASGDSNGNGDMVGQLIDYVLSSDSNPPENQECKWSKHPHPPFKDYEPVDITPGPDCP